MTYTDISLTCADCGATFTFTAGEQEFHAQKGFSNPPGRCSTCRAARRADRDGGGARGGQREMFSAVCATCGKEARVPFQPRGDKPVYCSSCFNPQSIGARSGSGARGNRW